MFPYERTLCSVGSPLLFEPTCSPDSESAPLLAGLAELGRIPIFWVRKRRSAGRMAREACLVYNLPSFSKISLCLKTSATMGFMILNQRGGINAIIAIVLDA